MIKQLSIEREYFEDTTNDLIAYGSTHLWMKAIFENINPDLKMLIFESNHISFNTVRSTIRISIFSHNVGVK